MSKYNRLARPIAVIGNRAAYMHLCHHCQVDPNGNDIFTHVAAPEQACGGPFCRVIEIDGADEIHDLFNLRSMVRSRIINDTTAQRSQIEASYV